MAKKLYTHKQIRKSIKQDELRNALEKLFASAKQNTENLLIAAIIVVVIAILVPLYFSNQRANAKRAAELLNRAVTWSVQPVGGATEAAYGGESFRNTEEKYKKTQQAFAEVSASYRNTPAGRQARDLEANSWFYLGEYAKAVEIYRADAEKATDPALKSSLQQRIGACQENMKEWAAARQTYETLLAAAPDFFNRRAVRLALARCQRHLGQTDAADKILQAEAAEEPGSYWAEAARQMLALAPTQEAAK
ncbi:MAG: tetratricopeptide repeat protein [candidate division FCPU426 bacterium]